MSQTLSIIHVFITANATKQRLAELTRHAVPSVFAGAAVLENLPGAIDQAKGIIKLPISEQPAVRGDLGAMKCEIASNRDPLHAINKALIL